MNEILKETNIQTQKSNNMKRIFVTSKYVQLFLALGFLFFFK